MFYLLAYIIRGGINRHRQKDQNFHCNKELFHAPNKINIDKEQKKKLFNEALPPPIKTKKPKLTRIHNQFLLRLAKLDHRHQMERRRIPPAHLLEHLPTPRIVSSQKPLQILQIICKKKKKTATKTTRSSDPIANNTIKKPNQSNSEATEHKSKAYQDNTGPWRTQRRPPSRPRRRRRGRRRRRRVLPRPSPPTRRRSAEAAAWRGDAKKNGAFLGGHGYMRSRHFNDGRSCQRDAHVRFGSGGSKPR